MKSDVKMLEKEIVTRAKFLLEILKDFSCFGMDCEKCPLWLEKYYEIKGNDYDCLSVLADDLYKNFIEKED